MCVSRFRGWPAEAIEFFEGLEADNSRTYWLEHKTTYDTMVRAPMDAVLAELAAEFGEGKVFRPNRDVRFSADKSPGHELLKTAPRGYPKNHPRVDLLRNKGLIAGRQWPVGKWLGTATAKDRVVEFLHASRPLNDWLAQHVGPSRG